MELSEQADFRKAAERGIELFAQDVARLIVIGHAEMQRQAEEVSRTLGRALVEMSHWGDR